MTEKKMTRAQALAFAIDFIKREVETPEGESAEAIEILTKMHASVTKPRKKSDTPSKTQLLNAKLAEKVMEALDGRDEAVTSKWICEHVNGIMTPQKCTAVMKILIDSGEVVKIKEGKTVTYAVVSE